jgi:hypothetical protein
MLSGVWQMKVNLYYKCAKQQMQSIHINIKVVHISYTMEDHAPHLTLSLTRHNRHVGTNAPAHAHASNNSFRVFYNPLL